ncbi:hypothetical protein H0H93_001896 [Arthromyces matolae]|nr:hypothetical protein H0H93_001896 [Arthromyces matolae]
MTSWTQSLTKALTLSSVFFLCVPTSKCAFDFIHPMHVALCKAISTFCGHTLRRLELVGVSVRMDRFERMLRYLSNLEVCAITRIIPLKVCGLRRGGTMLQWKRMLYDLDIDTDDDWTTVGWTSTREPYKGKPDPEMKMFSKKIRTEFRNAKRKLTWPPLPSPNGEDGRPGPCILPKLHTLFTSGFNDQFFEIQLPVCRYLVIGDGVYNSVIFDTNIYFDDFPSYDETGSDPNQYDNDDDYSGGYATPSEIPGYYANPVPHSTPFGLFPSTITHLEIYISRINLGLPRILYFFPNLIDLKWSDPGQKDPTPFYLPELSTSQSGFTNSNSRRNTTLRQIGLASTGFGFGEVRDKLNQEILYALREGILVSLEEVLVVFRGNLISSLTPKKSTLPIEELEKFGVKVTTAGFCD